MEPNWNRLWENSFRKICTKDEVVSKITSVNDSDTKYYYEYISADEWNDNEPTEAYIKIKKLGMNPE